MSETRTSALAIRTEPARAWTANIIQAVSNTSIRGAGWAVDTAQHFGSLLSALMGPAVFSAYAFATWSLAANLGWTNTFPYATGPLSNWLIWAGIAIAVHEAAQVLRRHTGTDKPVQK
jgi:hypothetical protein